MAIMAMAFPITVKGVEALTNSRNELQDSEEFKNGKLLFRGISVCQLLALLYILILQLFVGIPIFFGSEIFTAIGCEAWLNIFYTIGLFSGIYTNLYPTNTAIACYIGLEGLIAFTTFQKFLLDSRQMQYIQEIGTECAHAGFTSFVWASMVLANMIVLISAVLLLSKYLYTVCGSRNHNDAQSQQV